MEGWRDEDTALLTHGRGVKERGRTTERSLEESNSREWGTACAVKKPQHPAEREEDSALASFWFLNFDEEMTTLDWIIAGHFSDTDTCYCPPSDSMLVPTLFPCYCSFNRQILGITQQAFVKLAA